MKRLIILLFALAIFPGAAISQSCLPDGITFTSQEQIDSFQMHYPGCTEIEGDVRIVGGGITNLNGLGMLTAIWNNLSIGMQYSGGTSLANLTGLNNLTSVGGDLWIRNNDSLTSLMGLEELTSIGGSLNIGCGFPGDGNPILPSLTGLEGLTSIGGGLSVCGNDVLTNLLGLDSLISIGDGLGIFSNDSLTSLTGLESVSSIGGHLQVTGNPVLTDLSGMNNIVSIGGQLTICDNPALTSLTGLDNIDEGTINDIYIYNNGSLSDCEAIWLCDYLANPAGSINIHTNASGCNNPPEVANACGITLPCLPYGSYYFFTQDEIDSFQTDYPNCTDLEGYTNISGSDINNLYGLSGITSMGSVVIADNNILSSLTGLDNVNSIAFRLRLHNNDALSNLTGLGNLTSIGAFEIKWNDSLTNLSGLEGLTSIGDYLDISYNNSLTSLTGLNSLISTEWLEIRQNPALTSLMGLNNLTSIRNSLEIEFNGLTSLSGLEKLTSIDGDLRLDHNFDLTSLTGLEGLTSIGGQLVIIQHDALISLSGIDNIDAASISDLNIRYNDLLSTCEVQSICDYLSTPNGTVTIHSNATGCNSQEEVEEACKTVSVGDIETKNHFTIYPNPFAGVTTFSINLKKSTQVNLLVIDRLGRQVETVLDESLARGDHSITWNTEGLLSGIYFYRLTAGNHSSTGKLVVVR
jgi:hypothetical protein